MVATEGSIIYSVVVAKLNNITCRALLDIGCLEPVRKETKRIEMMMHPIVRKADVFEIKIEDLNGSFQFKSEVSKIEIETLLSLLNSNYEVVLKKHQH